MKIRLYAGTLSLLIAPAAFAQPPQWEPGFSGELAVITGYTRSNSQFNVENDTTDSILKPGSTKSKFLIAPLGSLQYTFANRQSQVFLGTDRSDVALGRFHLELGYRHKLQGKSQVSASFVPGVIPNKTWADPYLENQDRKETDSRIRALRFKYDNIANSNFSLEVAGGKRKIDDEHSGQNGYNDATQKLLKRDGNIYFAEASYRYPFSRQLFLRSALNYTKVNADGDAMANDAYGIEASLVNLFDQSSLVLTLNYHNVRFNETNPIYSQKQQDNRWGVFVAYAYQEPFGWKNWEAVSLSGYNKSNSNIDFYDEKSLMVSAGIGYKF